MLASMQKAVAEKAYHYNLYPVEYQWEVVRKLLALLFVRKAIGVGAYSCSRVRSNAGKELGVTLFEQQKRDEAQFFFIIHVTAGVEAVG